MGASSMSTGRKIRIFFKRYGRLVLGGASSSSSLPLARFCPHLTPSASTGKNNSPANPTWAPTPTVRHLLPPAFRRASLPTGGIGRGTRLPRFRSHPRTADGILPEIR